MYMGFIALSAGIGMFVQKYCFATLSEKVTYKMRFTLYDAILSKNIGWFDLRENSVGSLSATMASDTALVNGVSSESLGPIVESMFSLAVGLAIGFYYCW